MLDAVEEVGAGGAEAVTLFWSAQEAGAAAVVAGTQLRRRAALGAGGDRAVDEKRQFAIHPGNVLPCGDAWALPRCSRSTSAMHLDRVVNVQSLPSSAQALPFDDS